MVEPHTFPLPATDGRLLFVYRWLPAGRPRGIVHAIHGMAEHAGRYEGLAQVLNESGWAVYAHDQRGHGRTVAAPGELGYADFRWAAVLADVRTIQERIADDFPDLPRVLLGHSMGAFVAQQFAGEEGEGLSGLVLMGTYRESRWLARAGVWLARFEQWRLGSRGHSRPIRALTFDAFNRRFGPNRTNFDWLSRDPTAVDAYAADPLCGFAPSVRLWLEVFQALAAGLPVPSLRLPVCVLVGERDPVCGPDPSARKLVAQFRAAKVQVTHHVYPDARHELFHEINRAEVIRDLLNWLETILRLR